jgi:outer membrane protein assembly factor BamB
MNSFAVVPVLIGPLQVLVTLLPYLILAVISALISLLHPRAVLKGLVILWRQKLQVAVVAALCVALAVGLWYGGDWLWRTFGPETAVAAAVGGSDWPMARGSLHRRGAVAGDAAPTHGGVNWSYNRSGREHFLSSPAVVGNRVYIVSADFSNAFFKRGNIYCFDADSGAAVWKFTPPDYRPTFSSPVVSGRYLVCGEGLHETNDARVICLDISDDREPKVVWTHETRNHVECTPTIWKDRVVVNAGDDGVHCIALEPGPDGKARELWHAPGGKYLDCETALAVHEGKVYLGQGFDGNGLVVFDAMTGQEEKRLDVGAPVFSPPSIAGGKLYFAKGFADYIRNWEEARQMLVDKWERSGIPKDEIERRRAKIGPEGTVCCVDLKTWQIDWEHKIKETALGCVAVAGEQLICAARNGTVYVLSTAGKLLGTWDSHATTVTSPAVTDKHICVVTGNGLLCVLDRQSLELVWQVRLGTPTEDIKFFIGSPALARGRAYVGTVQDGFVCVGESGESRPVPLWTGALGGPGKAGNIDDSTIPSAGAQPITAREVAPGTVRAPVALRGNDLFVPLAEGDQAGLACYLADRPDVRWYVPLALGVHQSPALYNETIWCVDGKPGDTGRKLRALDTATGKQRWHAPIDVKASGVFLVTEDQLLIQDLGGKLAGFSHQGARKWEQWIGELKHAPAVTKAMIVAAPADPPVLVALDRPSGRVLWRRPLEAVPTTSPVVRKDRIIVGTHRGLEVRSLLDGAPVDDRRIEEGGGVSADFALLRDRAVYVNHLGELVIVNIGDGSVLGKLPGALAGRPPLVSRDTVLYLAKAGVMRLALQDDNLSPQVWLNTTVVGGLTSPLILADGRVYAGTANKGLVRMGN